MASKKKKKEKVFNDRERKIFRKRIPVAEIGFSAFFIGFTALMGIWFAAQRDNFDPSERDISMEVLIEQSVEDNLYKPPLKRWVDPAVARSTPGMVGPDLGIFPDAAVAGGWQVSGRVEGFDWDTLYEKIDGQEDQYKQYGFEYLHYVSLEKPGEDLTLNIELYDMGAFPNALGVFSAQRSEGRQVERQEKAYYYVTEVGAAGIVDKFYFKMTGNADSEVIRDHALRIVQEFATGIGDAEEGGAQVASRAFEVLVDGLAVDIQNIQYVKEDAFQYAFAKEFWFARSSEAGDNAQFFVHEAGDADEAKNLFDKFLEEQQFEYTAVEQDDSSAVMKHDFLDTFFSIEHDGPFVYGIEGAADEPGARNALSSLKSVISKTAASSAPATAKLEDSADTDESTEES